MSLISNDCCDNCMIFFYDVRCCEENCSIRLMCMLYEITTLYTSRYNYNVITTLYTTIWNFVISMLMSALELFWTWGR